MEKYITTKDKKEVKFGDLVVIESYDTSKFGECYFKEEVLLTENSLPYLLEKGAIMKVDTPKKPEIKVIDIHLILNKLSTQLNCSRYESWIFLESLSKLNLGAFLNIVCKKVAVECDKKYPDHIKDAKEIYIVDSMTNKVRKGKNNPDYLFTQFAAFRTEEDAYLAMEIATDLLDSYSFHNEED